MASTIFSKAEIKLHMKSIEKQVKYLEEAERKLTTTMSKDEENVLKEEAKHLKESTEWYRRFFNFVGDIWSDKRLKKEAYSLKAQKRRAELLKSKGVKLVQSKYNRGEIRIVLNGKSGKGKSALGNNLLGCDRFTSETSLKGITKKCTFGVRYLDREHKLLVVDTPGLFDSDTPNKDTSKEITKCVALAAPGPNIFLFVVSTERFTPEEKETLTNLQKLFGENVIDHVIIVFTRKDSLSRRNGIMEFMKGADGILLDLLVKCKFRFAFINNRADPDDVRVDIDVILDLIFKTIGENNGVYYTNKDFGIVDKALENMIKEKEEERVKELEKLKEQKRLVKHKEEKKTEPQKLEEEERKPQDKLPEDAGFKKVEEAIHDVGTTLREISIFLKQINIGDDESGMGNIEEKYENIQKLFSDQSKTVSESSNNEYVAMLISEIRNLNQIVNDLMAFLKENKTRKSSGEFAKELNSEFDKIKQRMDSMEDKMSSSPTVNTTVNVNPNIEVKPQDIDKRIQENKNRNVYYEVKKEIENGKTTTTLGQKVMEAAGVGAGITAGAAVVAGAVAVVGAPLVAAGAGAVAVGAGVAKAASWLKSWW